MTDISGQKCLELLKRSNQGGSWERMFSASLIGMPGWSSSRCYLIWRLKGTTSSRLYYQLQVSTLRIKDTASGLLPLMDSIPPQGTRKLIPTPVALDGSAPSLAAQLRKDETADNVSSLTAYVRLNWRKLIPTPTALDGTGCTAVMRSSQVKEGSMHSVTLSRWAASLPTPLTELRGPSALHTTEKTNPSSAEQTHGSNGQLNPRFVAEMMGFPEDWTELPFMNGSPKA